MVESPSKKYKKREEVKVGRKSEKEKLYFRGALKQQRNEQDENKEREVVKALNKKKI